MIIIFCFSIGSQVNINQTYESLQLDLSKILLIMLSVILFFASLLAISFASTTAFDYRDNQKYSYTGRSVVNMASQILAYGSDWENIPAVITIPLPKSFSINNSSSLKGLTTFGQFQTRDLTDGLSIQVYLGLLSSTQIKAQISSYNPLEIQRLTIFCFVFAFPDIYTSNMNLYQYYFDFGTDGYQINNDPGSEYPLSCNFPSAFNSTGILKAIVMMSGIFATYTNDNTQTIDVSLTRTLITPTNIIVTVSSNSADKTLLSQIMMNIIIYNVDFINSAASTIYRIYDGSFSITSLATSNYTSSLEMTSINTFVGLSTISINYLNTFSFYIAINQPNTISITSDIPFSSQNTIAVVFLVVLSNYCDYQKPYYSDYSSVCYSTCPGSDTSNDTTLKCQCYYQGSLTAESNCTTSIQSTSSSSSLPLGIIIGVIVGAVVLVIIIILVIRICRSRLKQPCQETKGATKLKAIVYFEGNQQIKELNDSRIILPQSNPPSNDNVEKIKRQAPVQPPIFNPTIVQQENPSKKQQQHNNQQISQWKKCEDKHVSNTVCCVCREAHTFLRSECSHYFHIQCMSKWLASSPTCPMCRAKTTFQFKYYCNICMLAYRNILIGSEPIDQTKLEKICEDCKKIPF